MKIIQQANKAARENARNINGVIKRDAKRVTEIVKSLQRAGVKPYSVHVDYSSYNICITGVRADLDIMFGVLRRAGLRPARRPEEKNTYYATFWYWDESGSEFIFVSFSSTSCKRVQVGTKMEEVPVYETICEE